LFRKASRLKTYAQDSIPRVIKVSPILEDENAVQFISDKTKIINGYGAYVSQSSINIDSGWKEILTGYKKIDEELGVVLYEYDSNGKKSYLQSIDLSAGASLDFRHGSSDNLNVDSPQFKVQQIDEAWKEFKASNPKAFSITNGQFFKLEWTNYSPGATAQLAFPTKINGQIITKGGSNDLMLEVWPDHADIEKFSQEKFQNTVSAPTILAALSEDNKDKDPSSEIGRTLIGLDDSDGNGSYETVLIFNSEASTSANAASNLKTFGADKVIMLDGSGSSKLMGQRENDPYLPGDKRRIPQTIGVIHG
jgi:Phosphodiester glycosidase